PALPLAARRLVQPLRSFECTLADGAFALFDDGMPLDAERRLPTAVALARIAERLVERREDPQSAAEDVVAEAVKRYRKRHTDDFFALVARRHARS
ncbi:MAG: hypothetical protein ACXVAN_00455, partial [Polyangia bacterium]